MGWAKVQLPPPPIHARGSNLKVFASLPGEQMEQTLLFIFYLKIKIPGQQQQKVRKKNNAKHKLENKTKKYIIQKNSYKNP